MPKKRLAVMASGKGTNLQRIIETIHNGFLNAQIAVVLSDREDAPALKRAAVNGINYRFLNPADYSSSLDYDRALVEQWQLSEVDLVLLAGFMRIIGTEAVNAFRYRIMNIHPSLLPAFPGLDAQKQALEYGVKYSGCTVHFVDEGMDTGPIISQAVVPVFEEDSLESLSARILAEEHRLYPEAIKMVLEEKIKIEGRKVRCVF